MSKLDSGVEKTMESEAVRETARLSLTAERLAAQMLDAGDLDFLKALKAAGLLGELTADELLRLASEVEDSDPERRRVDLVERYYEVGDPRTAERRQMSDRYFIQRAGEPATANMLVERLVRLCPELGQAHLEHIGGPHGPLVLRAGEHHCAVLDEYDEETETGDYDLRAAEESRRNSRVMMVTVRGLVRAINVMLGKRATSVRLIALRGDAEREVYVALGLAEAVQLAQLGHLEDEDSEDLVELGGW